MILSNKNGEIERKKTRIVVQEFLQRSGIDFHETYASVVRLSSIQLIYATRSNREDTTI